jgi:hypothetical protein
MNRRSFFVHKMLKLETQASYAVVGFEREKYDVIWADRDVKAAMRDAGLATRRRRPTICVPSIGVLNSSSGLLIPSEISESMKVFPIAKRASNRDPALVPPKYYGGSKGLLPVT